MPDRFDPRPPGPHFTEVGWVALCRRTNDPKLRYIEAWLDRLGIEHRRHGRSAHGPILEVPEDEHDRAYTTILLAPVPHWGIFDDIPDDNSLFP